jgi:hypothetical protein
MSEHSYGGRVLAVVALITILLVAGLSYQYMMGTSEDQRNIVGVIIMDQTIISSDTARTHLGAPPTSSSRYTWTYLS